MNDYLDYYNYMNSLNELQKQNYNQFQKDPPKNILEEPYTGFTRGNMYLGLYNEYKNYKPQEINPQNNKTYLELLMQMYCFAAHDLSLYLDINPNDTNIIKQRAEYIRMYNEILTQYESNYGPITKDSLLLEVTPWAWDTKKWPWEGKQ